MTSARPRRTRVVVGVAGLALVLTPITAATAADATPEHRAPVLSRNAPDAIKGDYIVVLDKNASLASVDGVAAVATAAGGTVSWTYSHTIKGFAATLPNAALAAVRADPAVRYVEADGVVRLDPSEAPITDDVQKDPTWGLDRTDQHALPLDQRYEYDQTGTGVKAYIVDTGIRITHEQYEGRAVYGYDFVRDDEIASDCNGHGTHVAGTVGSKLYGIAKDVELVAMRVLNCNGRGNWSRIIAATDWAAADRGDDPGVANLSLGGPRRKVFNEAIVGAIDSGLVVVVSAGNSNVDAFNASPASTVRAITVGASSNTDAKASFSNYGDRVDIFGPGVNILSTSFASDTATATLSGTSMSAPHVTGVVALYLETNPDATPKEARDALVRTSTKDELTGLPADTKNRLLFSLDF